MFKHNMPVHWTGAKSSRYGRNFLVRYEVPTGCKRMTWRLVSPNGDECRLKRASWDKMLEKGWYHGCSTTGGTPFTADETDDLMLSIIGKLDVKRAGLKPTSGYTHPAGSSTTAASPGFVRSSNELFRDNMDMFTTAVEDGTQPAAAATEMARRWEVSYGNLLVSFNKATEDVHKLLNEVDALRKNNLKLSRANTDLYNTMKEQQIKDAQNYTSANSKREMQESNIAPMF